MTVGAVDSSVAGKSFEEVRAALGFADSDAELERIRTEAEDAVDGLAGKGVTVRKTLAAAWTPEHIERLEAKATRHLITAESRAKLSPPREFFADEVQDGDGAGLDDAAADGSAPGSGSLGGAVSEPRADDLNDPME